MDHDTAVTATHLLTIVIAAPVLVVMWALVLEAALTAIGSPDNTAIAETAVAAVAAARLLAYLRQKTAHELSKAIPLALSLLLGGLPRIEDNLQTFTDGTCQSGITIEMLTFLLALEIALRVVNDLTRTSATVIRRATKRPPQGRSVDSPRLIRGTDGRRCTESKVG